MIYTKESMSKHLKSLSVWKWDWAGNEPDKVRADVKALNPGVTAGGFHEIVEYCWKAYEKALNSSGHQVIGRCDNLAVTATRKDAVTGNKVKVAGADLYEKVADITGDKTLFDPKTQGNLLQMDKWAAVMNDAWILGGVHRRAQFRLASGLVIQNIWNTKGFLIVTARELIGLFTFGYALEQVGPWQVLNLQKDGEALAVNADLLKYDAAIKKGGTPQDAQKLRDKQGSSARAAQQVQDFKKR